MAFALADLVRERVSITGTGVVSLGGVLVGYDTFAAHMAVGDTTRYVIIGTASGSRETGIGTYGAGNTLVRTVVETSSNGGALVNFAGELCDVMMVVSANALRSLVDPNYSALSNYTAPLMKRWRRAVARVRDGSGRGRLLVIGDSTSMGAGAGSGGTTNLNGAFAKSWLSALAKIPNPFVPFSLNSFVGNQGTLVAYSTYDPRVSVGTGWTNVGAGGTLGAQLWSFATGAVGVLGFTPTSQIDTIVPFYVRQAAQGTIAVSVDSGASLGTITCTGASALLSASYTVTKGTHTIKLTANNDGGCYVSGVLAYDSTVPGIDIIPGAWFGSKAGNFAVTGSVWQPLAAIATYAPDLTLINLTINDSNGGTALATYITQLQQIITAAQAVGDVMLMIGIPSNTTQATDGTLAGFIAAVNNLALINGCPVLDMSNRWQSYAAINPIFPYFDNLHAGALGYQDEAQAVYDVLARL